MEVIVLLDTTFLAPSGPGISAIVRFLLQSTTPPTESNFSSVIIMITNKLILNTFYTAVCIFMQISNQVLKVIPESGPGIQTVQCMGQGV